MLPIEDLTAQLREALRIGHGRAARLFAAVSPAIAREELLAACLRNSVYDTQCEPSRAPWLRDWVRRFGLEDAMREQVVAALYAAPPPSETDQYQLVELLQHRAAAGDTIARTALYELLGRSADEQAYAALEIAVAVVELDELDGLLAAGRAVGSRLANDCEGNLFHLLGSELLERFGEERVHALIEAHRHEPGVDAVWASIEAERERKEALRKEREARKERRKAGKQEKKPPRPGYSETEIDAIIEPKLRCIEEGGEYPRPLPLRAQRNVTEAQLWPLVEWLARESRPAQLRHLLVTFRNFAPPLVPPRIYELAQSANDEAIQAAAIRLLSNVEQPPVRELALELLASPQRARHIRLGAIRMLLHHFRPGDADLATATLNQLGELDSETRHNIGFDINHVAKQHDQRELAPWLEWVYNHTPCLNCRSEAVEHLHHRNALPRNLIEECLHDADETIRALASSMKAS